MSIWKLRYLQLCHIQLTCSLSASGLWSGLGDSHTRAPTVFALLAETPVGFVDVGSKVSAEAGVSDETLVLRLSRARGILSSLNLKPEAVKQQQSAAEEASGTARGQLEGGPRQLGL